MTAMASRRGRRFAPRRASGYFTVKSRPHSRHVVVRNVAIEKIDAWFQIEPQRAGLTGIELGDFAQMNAGFVLVDLGVAGQVRQRRGGVFQSGHDHFVDDFRRRIENLESHLARFDAIGADCDLPSSLWTYLCQLQGTQDQSASPQLRPCPRAIRSPLFLRRGMGSPTSRR